ncbi:hypothetical protein ASG01_10140 [Chryseobacterium sp. Leaf180]|uniref:hypothetical protein n=1 Tax=Chryseobacterium sp. Leaf180 TaxID=1736289 RepID=UPI0006F46C81|nr:hypothetical protein [Chryseobacterium sp. Leaf180]KQR93524.1 hypothetical protein ASG01_10140 [Chryseobacterium sp. Leaf180]
MVKVSLFNFYHNFGLRFWAAEKKSAFLKEDSQAMQNANSILVYSKKEFSQKGTVFRPEFRIENKRLLATH